MKIYTQKNQKKLQKENISQLQKVKFKKFEKNAGELDDWQVQEPSSRYNLSILLDASISPSTALKVDDDDDDDDDDGDDDDKLLLQNG